MKLACAIKNDKGATSVLVIFMLMILATMGAFAITSANANYKLSRRALEWNEMFYELDAIGEEYLFALDSKLAEAEARTFEASLAAMTPDTTSGETASDAADGASADAAGENADIQDIDINDSAFSKLYMENAVVSLNEFVTEHQDFELIFPESYGTLTYVTISGTIWSEYPEMENCGLKMSVVVEPSDLQVGGLRYRITEWNEFQGSAVEEPSDGLWDGIFNF